MSNKERTCCFTGHRKIPSEQYKYIVGRLRNELIQLIESGIIYFGTGGALGFDTLAAQAVLLSKADYPQIKLILVLPCREQTRGWMHGDIKIYEDIKASADKVVYTSEHYDQGCMFNRNRHLADNSGVCICYLTEPTGGTAYTVRYAKSKGLKIINIAE